MQRGLEKTISDHATKTILGEERTKKFVGAIDKVLYPGSGSKQDRSAWQKVYPNTRSSSGFVEGFMDTSLYQDILTNNEIRWDAFNQANNFHNNCVENARQSFQDLYNSEKDDLNKLKKFMNSFIKSYESLFNFKASLGAIKNNKRNQLKNIKNKIDTYKQNLFMDDRKDSYHKKNFEFYKTIYFYVLIVYYALFILYLIFSNFFKEQQYKNKYLVLALLIYLLIPLILPYILLQIYNLYIFILEYNYLKEDAISYPHIIEDQDHIKSA